MQQAEKKGAPMLGPSERVQRSAIAPVALHPPVIFLGALVLGCVLAVLFPLGPGFARASSAAFMAGGGLTLAGLFISLWAVRDILNAGSHVPTWQPTTAIVTGGAYGLSRNPIYIAMLVIFLGLAIALTNLWMVLLLPIMAWALHHAVVKPEEAYLADRFGAAYEDYRRHVPRWV